MIISETDLDHEGRISVIETKIDTVIIKLDEIYKESVRQDAERRVARSILRWILKGLVVLAPIGLWAFGGKWRDLSEYLKDILPK